MHNILAIYCRDIGPDIATRKMDSLLGCTARGIRHRELSRAGAEEEVGRRCRNTKRFRSPEISPVLPPIFHRFPFYPPSAPGDPFLPAADSIPANGSNS